MEPIIFIIAGAILVTGIIFLVIRADRRRREGIEERSAALGLDYRQKDDLGLLETLAGFSLVSQGRSKRVENILSGSAHGIDLHIFDYRYTTGGGQHSHTVRQTVILLGSGTMQLPRFTMRPQNIFHKIGKTFGYKDIDFDNQPEFSGSYLLRGEDETAIRKLFTGRPISYFKRNPKLCVEGAEGQLIFYRSGKRVAPDNIKQFLERGIKIFGLFVKQ